MNERRGLESIHVSPTNTKTVFVDAPPPLSFEEMEREGSVRGVLIGGGNIIHLRPGIYQSLEKNINYADLWIGATAYALRRKIPVCYNNPGLSLSRRLSKLKMRLIKASFLASTTLCFRDHHSISAQYTHGSKHLNPDTAFAISKVFPVHQTIEKVGVCINLNQRYFPSPEKVASVISNSIFFKSKKLNFVIIGECHGDAIFTKKVISHLSDEVKFALVDTSLEGIAKTIAKSELFIGSSMHGFITALSYRVNAILVNNDEQPLLKFTDLFTYARLHHQMRCSDFSEIENSLDSAQTISEASLQNLFGKLEKHWDSLVSVVEKQEKRKPSIVNRWLIKNYKIVLIGQGLKARILTRLRGFLKKI